MKNNKHILTTILIVSIAMLSLVAMLVFQNESANELVYSKPCNQQGDITKDTIENTRKGVLVDSLTESQMTG
jgi:hypothetical protein